MQAFNSFHVIGEDWRDLCDRVLAAGVSGRPTDDGLAFIYIADRLAADTDRIIDCLREGSGIPHWVGCVGMGLCSSALETYEEAALSILTTPFNGDQFRVIPALEEGSKDWLNATRTWREQHLATVAIVHADPGANRLPVLLDRLSADLQGGYLVGGISSAESLPVQIADRATGSGLSGVLFGADVSISTGLSQGCSLIGHRHRITACERNIITTIDDRPALDVLKEEIGEVLARDLRRIGGYIFAALPIAGSDTGDYLVRNLLGIDPDQGLVAIGDLPTQGSEIQFARRDAESAREDLRQMIGKLLARLPDAPRGALYHSCLGRGRNLFGEDSGEMKLVAEMLGDIPLAGFYANGEISHNRLYGYTGVLTLFS